LDHDHLMHLYLIRQPGMDVVYHLHPDQVAPGEFQLPLPSVPAGTYSLFADVVHATGFPETLVASIPLPEITGRPLAGDDAKGLAQPLPAWRGASPSCAAIPTLSRFNLPDGYTMVWNNPASQTAKTPEIFAFSLLGVDGKPAQDMALYMGMPGHAAFIKQDGTVFAHVHPSGTVSMTALMMAAAQNQPEYPQRMQPQSSRSQPDFPPLDAMGAMPGMAMPAAIEPLGRPPDTVGFPYGFPTPGAYRIFVQMKHGQTVETAAFDACAGSPKVN
jgi:hypothetical protein